jgi:hypothetical protein
MIKWIGQHIVSLIARFRDDVYLENLTESTQDHVVGIDADGKLYKQDKGTTDSFTVEDGDTTDVVISNGKHWKFVEGGGININWTDTSTGSSTDEYDLTFTITKTLSDFLQEDNHIIRGVAPHDVLIQSAQNLKFQIDYDESSTPGTHTFDFINGAGSTVATIDESGVPTFSIGGKGSAASSVIVDGGSGSLTSRTLSEFKSDASLSNVENKSSATIRGEIVDSDIPNLNASKINAGTFADAQIPNLNASKINAGTLADAQIPNLAASKITSGTFGTSQIPSLDTNKLTTGVLPVARGGTGVSSLGSINVSSLNNDSGFITSGSSGKSFITFSTNGYVATSVNNELHLGHSSYGNYHFNWASVTIEADLDTTTRQITKNEVNCGWPVPVNLSKVEVRVNCRTNGSSNNLKTVLFKTASELSGNTNATVLGTAATVTGAATNQFNDMTITDGGAVSAGEVIYVGVGCTNGTPQLRFNITILGYVA